MGSTALHGQHRCGSDEKGERPGGDVNPSKRRDQSVHGSTSSAPPPTAAPLLEPLQVTERLHAPLEHRAAPVLAVVKGHQREEQLRTIGQLLAEASLDRHVGLEELLLALRAAG